METSNKTLAGFMLVSFFIGMCLYAVYLKNFTNYLPDLIELKVKGQPEAWAFTSSPKVVHAKDGDNPGAFLAFPIYGPYSKRIK